ncbi:MAG TPA: gluconate 2-dehydrogenase subunit 3 family protein, partial [Gemmatimonadaceae bacterium]|nr:gluconate 2-dehydrogenase subunit 3 family protein [Gemmatimonadaceae bacterium]
LALVAAVADTIIPRADTPGAVDVGVPAFVEAVVDASWPEDDRATFTGGLNALQSRLGGASGSAPGARGDAIDAIEGELDRGAEPVRTYWRLKSLIVHGYFTSEPVMKDVLHVQVIPGRFDGAAPMRAVRAPSQSTGAPHHG